MPSPDLAQSLTAEPALTLIGLGSVLALSILCDAAARHLDLPRVSILVLAGVAIAAVARGVLGYDIYEPADQRIESLLDLALVMVAFLLGGDLTRERWQMTGRPVIALSLGVTLASAFVVAGGCLLAGLPAILALPLAAMAVATDPAAVQDVINETGASGRRAAVLRGVVAIDDAWGVIAFGVALALLGWLTGSDGWTAIGEAGWELGGSVLLGLAIGVPGAYVTGRLKPGQPTQAEALAIILLITGLANLLEISSLLAGMVAGAAIANLSRHHERSFREIEHIEWPFLVFFFVAAGAAADPWQMVDAAPLIVGYIALRALARLAGGWLAWPILDRVQAAEYRWLGAGLMPQAGVAMGMALLAAERYPDVADQLIMVAVAGTVFFEILGPVLTRRLLRSA